MLRRRMVLAGLALMMFAGAAVADQPMIYARYGAAIAGYDPVAYFTKGAPVRGKPEHRVMWKGAVWYFATDQNRVRFESNPRAFAPRYGGYCSYAVSQGYTATGDPTAWSIHNGKLYLTHNRQVFEIWKRDIPGNVVRANANWPAVLGD